MSPVRKIEEFCWVISNQEDVFQRHGTARSGDSLHRAEAAVPAHLFLISRNILTSLKNKKPTRCHLLYYSTSYRLNTFRAYYAAARTLLQPNCT